MELGPSNPVLWAHKSLSSGPSSHEQPLSTAQPPGTYLGQLGRVGSEERQSLLEPSAPKAAARKSQQSAPQHQQLLPQNTRHRWGCARHSAKPWGWRENGGNQGKAGFQNLPGLCVGSPPSGAHAKRPPRAHSPWDTLPSDRL